MSSSPLAAASIRELVSGDLLKPVFQPIAALRDAGIFGYGSLIRGPGGTAFADPEQLFAKASVEGSVIDLELHCCVSALREFTRCRVSGKLLINLSAAAVQAFASGRLGSLPELARSFGGPPGRLLIELTEHERIHDFEGLAAALTVLRGAGIGLALDDFGDGRSSFKIWTELQPDLVKVDRQIVQGLHARSRNLEILRVYLYVAERFGGTLVAEGGESEDDLVVLRDVGVGYAQGFLLGYPAPVPATEIPSAVVAALISRRIAVLPEMDHSSRGGLPAGAPRLEVSCVPV